MSISRNRPLQVAGLRTRPFWWRRGDPHIPSGGDKVHPTDFSALGCEHLRPVIDTFAHTLSAAEFVVAERLMHDYADVFSRSEFDLGRTDILPHRIDTGDARPFKEQLRLHPIAHLDFIDNQVDHMLRAGVIEPSSSPWSSNVVLAKKSDGSLRFCVDYRRLNNLTYKDSFPLSRIDTCLDALGGSMHFFYYGPEEWFLAGVHRPT